MTYKGLEVEASDSILKTIRASFGYLLSDNDSYTLAGRIVTELAIDGIGFTREPTLDNDEPITGASHSTWSQEMLSQAGQKRRHGLASCQVCEQMPAMHTPTMLHRYRSSLPEKS